MSLRVSLGLILLLLSAGCTSIQNDFGSTDFSSFSVNGTYTGSLRLSDAAMTTLTDSTAFEISLTQNGANITGTATSKGDSVSDRIGIVTDNLTGTITYYTNYFAHIDGYIYPKSETLDAAKKDSSAIPMDLVVNTLTNISEGNLFPHGDSVNYVEFIGKK